MRELPTGTVTFLFTDVEGSTKLLHELGEDGYSHALADHRRLLRDAFARHGGIEVDTQGDAFFVAFATAPAALAAAREAQQQLVIPVRMGIHTGTPQVTEEGYVGLDVHRAARIAAAGHGRQVLVSETTPRLVHDASDTLLLVDLVTCRSGRTPAQGPRPASAPLPARRGRVPASALAQPDEPPRVRNAVLGARGGARGCEGATHPGAGSAAHAHGRGRKRKDPARAAGGG